jgi:hypothetical protein
MGVIFAPFGGMVRSPVAAGFILVISLLQELLLFYMRPGAASFSFVFSCGQCLRCGFLMGFASLYPSYGSGFLCPAFFFPKESGKIIFSFGGHCPPYISFSFVSLFVGEAHHVKLFFSGGRSPPGHTVFFPFI